jgi:hypothetical protein
LSPEKAEIATGKKKFARGTKVKAIYYQMCDALVVKSYLDPGRNVHAIIYKPKQLHLHLMQ